MSIDMLAVRRDLVARASGHGISVHEGRLKDDTAGKFDGPTITLNLEYETAEQTIYLAHSIGSIAEWSLHFDRSYQAISELRQAKRQKDAKLLQQAIASYLAFEERTWESSAWLLIDLSHAWLLSEFTTFGRADLESMRILHATGSAPVWRDFYADWKRDVTSGVRKTDPFVPRPITKFLAIRIPKQEIVQEDG